MKESAKVIEVKVTSNEDRLSVAIEGQPMQFISKKYALSVLANFGIAKLQQAHLALFEGANVEWDGSILYKAGVEYPSSTEGKTFTPERDRLELQALVVHVSAKNLENREYYASIKSDAGETLYTPEAKSSTGSPKVQVVEPAVVLDDEHLD